MGVLTPLFQLNPPDIHFLTPNKNINQCSFHAALLVLSSLHRLCFAKSPVMAVREGRRGRKSAVQSTGDRPQNWPSVSGCHSERANYRTKNHRPAKITPGPNYGNYPGLRRAAPDGRWMRPSAFCFHKSHPVRPNYSLCRTFYSGRYLIAVK